MQYNLHCSYGVKLLIKGSDFVSLALRVGEFVECTVGSTVPQRVVYEDTQ